MARSHYQFKKRQKELEKKKKKEEKRRLKLEKKAVEKDESTGIGETAGADDAAETGESAVAEETEAVPLPATEDKEI